MKYRYMVVHEGVVEAADKSDAEGAALAMADGGFAETTAVQVELIETEDGDNA
jgi:hypothetical protein